MAFFKTGYLDYLFDRGSYRGDLGAESYALSSVVAEICDRAGMDYTMFDVSDLRGYVLGYQVSSSHQAFTHIRDLASIFFFDPANQDGKLHFVQRGGDPVAIITDDDMIDTGDAIRQTKRKDGVVPRVLNFQYYDIEGELEPSMQVSDRSIYLRENSEMKISTPVVMDQDDAIKIAVIMHRAMLEEQDGEIEFALPDSSIKLAASDVIVINGDRFRILEVSIDDGFQEYRAVRDSKSVMVSASTGLAPVSQPIPTYDPGATTIEVLDIPALRSVDDRLGYYVAIAGASDAWKGATVSLSTDGGANYANGQTSQTYAVMGTLNAPMAAHSRELPDYQNTIEITLVDDSEDLEAATFAEMLNRKNRALIGDEVVCFGEAQETTPGVWELSDLLRGRLYTDPVMHNVGERFVLLEDDYLPFIEMEPHLRDEELYFKAVSINGTAQTIISETVTGKSQKEPPPGYLRARRSGGNLIINWIGTGTKGGKTNVLMSAGFTGYRVRVNGAVSDITASTLTVPDPGGAVTISVNQLHSITGEGQTAQITI